MHNYDDDNKRNHLLTDPITFTKIKSNWIISSVQLLRSLAGYSPWGHRELDRTQPLSIQQQCSEGLMYAQFSSVTQSCLVATAWTEARQASLSITNSQSLLKLMSIE